jgi:hypothetical protein
MDRGDIVFGKKFPGEKRKCEILRCGDVSASSFVVKLWGQVFAHFHAVALKRHSNMRN